MAYTALARRRAVKMYENMCKTVGRVGHQINNNLQLSGLLSRFPYRPVFLNPGCATECTITMRNGAGVSPARRYSIPARAVT